MKRTKLNMISTYSYFLVLAFVHQFEGVKAESSHFFRAGEDVTLPCPEAASRGPECSYVDWFYYNREGSRAVDRVKRGSVVKSSRGSSRVSLAPNCFLNIHNVTEEDAGRYVCSLSEQNTWDTIVYLETIKVSRASDPDVSRFTVQCSVSKYSRQCRDGRIVWSDHKGKITTNVTQNSCESFLTVERHRIRTFTCQYLDEDNKVLISANFTPETDHAHRYSRAGENITLPCERLDHLGPACSGVTWSHYKDSSSSSTSKVSKGPIQGSDSRLKLNLDCSLTVQNVSAQDSGSFLCRQGDRPDPDTSVYLSVLTVSSAPPDPNQNIALRCTLWRHTGLTCSPGRFLWLDQDQKEVLSERRENCESDLTVELQSPHTRTFTCQYQEEGKVLVSAEYSLMVEKKKDTCTRHTYYVHT